MGKKIRLRRREEKRKRRGHRRVKGQGRERNKQAGDDAGIIKVKYQDQYGNEKLCRYGHRALYCTIRTTGGNAMRALWRRTTGGPDGIFMSVWKVGRMDPCPSGSTKVRASNEC